MIYSLILAIAVLFWVWFIFTTIKGLIKKLGNVAKDDVPEYEYRIDYWNETTFFPEYRELRHGTNSTNTFTSYYRGAELVKFDTFEAAKEFISKSDPNDYKYVSRSRYMQVKK